MATRYTINVDERQVDDLKTRLSLARFPDELDEAGWDYGTPLGDIKRLAQYWKASYDWRRAENNLNALPNFHTVVEVDGFDAIDLHYLHQPSSNPKALPLLFCHGWPGSYIEVVKLLPLLANDFHVVAPSLPNFAWSAGIKKRGFGLAQYAETCHKLMQHLGYSKHVTQGGDWGFYITRAIGLLYPQSCLASHINMIRAHQPSWSTHPLLALAHATTAYTDFEKQGWERSQWFANEGSGYRHIQCTKPQTPGYAVADSPVGLLAWLLEKLHDWTDNYPWTDDEILTWVSIYWFSTAGPAASLRIYYEATHQSVPSLKNVSRDRTQAYIPEVKVGLCYAPKELTILPRNWGRTLGSIVFESQHEKGGHFLAHECPEAIAGDLKKMFAVDGPCADVVASLRK